MIAKRFDHAQLLTLVALTILLLSACGTAPPGGTAAIPESTAAAGKKSFRVVLDDEFALDYEVDTRISALDGKSCYSFITGSLTNNSPRRLARQSVLDFIVSHKGKMLFRDITNPRSDIPPGNRVMFTMVESPVHSKSCPSYDRIDVSLRKVFQN